LKTGRGGLPLQDKGTVKKVWLKLLFWGKRSSQRLFSGLFFVGICVGMSYALFKAINRLSFTTLEKAKPWVTMGRKAASPNGSDCRVASGKIQSILLKGIKK